MDPILTLTTDFGTRDPFVAMMKGVILGILPGARIVDVSHHVPPGDLRAAASLMADACPLFPAGTVHVCVVDPGVGSDRRALVVERDGSLFVGPDNGVLSPFLRGEVRVRQIRNSEYFRRPVSSTFHGRDVFAPVAARLAAGLDPARLGPLLDDPVVLDEALPVEGEGEIRGCVLRIDRFGNLITNIPAEMLEGAKRLRVYVAGRRLEGISRCFADLGPGEAGFLVGSTGRLEIFVNRGSAARTLGAAAGDGVRVEVRDGGSGQKRMREE